MSPAGASSVTIRLENEIVPVTDVDRAKAFYEKCGWLRTGIVTDQLQVPNGSFALDVWRYEKSLIGSART